MRCDACDSHGVSAARIAGHKRVCSAFVAESTAPLRSVRQGTHGLLYSNRCTAPLRSLRRGTLIAFSPRAARSQLKACGGGELPIGPMRGGRGPMHVAFRDEPFQFQAVAPAEFLGIAFTLRA